MNPLYYSLFIEPGLDQGDSIFFALLLGLMVVIGVGIWIYELIQRFRK